MNKGDLLLKPLDVVDGIGIKLYMILSNIMKNIKREKLTHLLFIKKNSNG
jgi:hypothetical protein